MPSATNYHLGRYVQVRERNDGTHYVFMSVPASQRPDGWRKNIRLPQIGGRRHSLENQTYRKRIIHEAALLNKSLDQRRRAPVVHDRSKRTIIELVAIYNNSAEYKRLSAHRKQHARLDADKIIQWCESRDQLLFETIAAHDIEDFLDLYDDRPTQRVAMRTMWNVLCRHAVRAKWRLDNPCASIAWQKPRWRPVQIWSKEDIFKYTLMALRMREPGLAAIIQLGSVLGQRLGDLRTAKHGLNYGSDGVLRLKQSKTGAKVAPPLNERLRNIVEAVRVEGSPYLFNDGRTGTKFTASDLTHRFAEVRIAAMAVGTPHLLLRALRHTAVCSMVVAECTVPEIASVTGHELESVHRILKRYFVDYEGVARKAMERLNKREGGSIADFLPVAEQVPFDWDAKLEPKMFQFPPFDEERPGRYVAALDYRPMGPIDESDDDYEKRDDVPRMTNLASFDQNRRGGELR